ncbi:MAG: hypothetical protein M1825_005644 [Sarcosagium campestre]|nr:MAG: hypothetical protein M1825_005644 [Sarcosagium campestre]
MRNPFSHSRDRSSRRNSSANQDDLDLRVMPYEATTSAGQPEIGTTPIKGNVVDPSQASNTASNDDERGRKSQSRHYPPSTGANIQLTSGTRRTRSRSKSMIYRVLQGSHSGDGASEASGASSTGPHTPEDLVRGYGVSNTSDELFVINPPNRRSSTEGLHRTYHVDLLQAAKDTQDARRDRDQGPSSQHGESIADRNIGLQDFARTSGPDPVRSRGPATITDRDHLHSARSSRADSARTQQQHSKPVRSQSPFREQPLTSRHLPKNEVSIQKAAKDNVQNEVHQTSRSSDALPPIGNLRLDQSLKYRSIPRKVVQSNRQTSDSPNVPNGKAHSNVGNSDRRIGTPEPLDPPTMTQTSPYSSSTVDPRIDSTPRSGGAGYTKLSKGQSDSRTGTGREGSVSHDVNSPQNQEDATLHEASLVTSKTRGRRSEEFGVDSGTKGTKGNRHRQQSQDSQWPLVTGVSKEVAGLDDVVDLHDSVDTEVITTQAPAVVQEKVLNEIHHVREEKIHRDIHTHDTIHRIQPIIDVQVLPPRHFIPVAGGGLKEVSADEIPGRLRHWGVVETVSRDPQSQEKPFQHIRRDIEEGDSRTITTEEGYPRTETTWKHPQTVETGAKNTGQTWPLEINPSMYGSRSQ